MNRLTRAAALLLVGAVAATALAAAPADQLPSGIDLGPAGTRPTGQFVSMASPGANPLAQGAAAAGANARATQSPGAHIGLSIVKGHVIAYVCDGDRANGRFQTVSEWFRGGVSKTKNINLRSKGGARLTAELIGNRVVGTVRLADGTVLSFSARRVAGKARFLFLTDPPNGVQAGKKLPRTGSFLRGWIRLPGGTERGTNKPGRGQTALCGNLEARGKKLVAKEGNLTANEAAELNGIINQIAANC